MKCKETSHRIINGLSGCWLLAVGSRDCRGVTLIDTLVGSALMVVVFTGIIAAFQLSLVVVGNNKARAGAISLSNERMEYLRSLAYSQIGVIGGIPAGNVPQIENATSSDIVYTRRTSVQYTDDPGDGLGIADTNGVIADYKTIRVETSWRSRQGQRSITVVGRVSPQGIEAAVPGGTLVISVENAAAAPLYDIQVDITNTSTTPVINIRTYTNVNGEVTFIGAPAASNYQVVVSKSGYSTAQTYSVSVQNPNPNPRHLTVTASQTTSASFAIDRLSSKTVETYKAIVEQTWQDTFSDATKIATSSNITVSGGTAHLTGPVPYPSWGAVQSVAITPQYLSKWKTFTASSTAAASTTIEYRIYDGAGSLIPDGALPGNASGFASSTVDLTGLSIVTYPSLRVEATLQSQATSTTPSVDQLSLVYDYGPEPLPNLQFTMRGDKTIGNDPTVYKYNQLHSIGAGASVTLSNIEWDSYTLTVPGTGYAIAESCNPQPETLVPASSQTTKLYVKTQKPHSLLVDVYGTGNVLLEGASARLTRTGYDVTQSTSACGQTFFDDIAATTYTLTVTKAGYQQYTNVGVAVSGETRISATLAP
ncbi:MAG: carboxypeptidase-like regulatory domain-containing protein [bacterium]|nr:carboxypeptidase-like regulatory domain-containing protein [bacterium]